MARPCVLLDGLREIELLVFFADACQCPAAAKMSRRWVVVAAFEDILSKTGGDYLDPRQIFVPEVIFVMHALSDGEACQSS